MTLEQFKANFSWWEDMKLFDVEIVYLFQKYWRVERNPEGFSIQVYYIYEGESL